MNTQPEALRLADALENTPNWQKEEWGSNWKSSAMQYSREPFQAATELRRLHEVNQMLVGALETLIKKCNNSDGEEPAFWHETYRAEEKLAKAKEQA